jgi:hypothetical protein
MEETNMSQPKEKTGTVPPKKENHETSSQQKADSSLKKFQDLLRQLFQIEAADLDFGIYRIMNARREEIMRFFNDELLPQVRECLGLYERESRAVLQAELEKAKEQAKALGFEDPAQAPKVKELQERYNAALDIKEAENEVFSHLYNFFLKANPSELEGFDEYNASGFYHALFLHKPADKRGAKSDEAYTCKVMDKMANARNLNRGDVI